MGDADGRGGPCEGALRGGGGGGSVPGFEVVAGESGVVFVAVAAGFEACHAGGGGGEDGDFHAAVAGEGEGVAGQT